MTDLIKREEVYAEIEDWLKLMRYYHSDEDESNYAMPIEELRARIERIESVEQDRPVGHWIEHHRTDLGPALNDMCECSKCNIWFSLRDFQRRSYCPNCGAKMVEPQEVRKNKG